MPNDIVRNMRLSPDWNEMPIPVGTVPQGVKEYLRPQSFLKRGFYPVGTDQGPEPRLPSRRETGRMMGSVMDPARNIVMPLGFAKRISQVQRGAQRLKNMKSISNEAYEQATKTLNNMAREFPPLARQRLQDVEVLAGKSEVSKGVGGRYWPERVQPPVGGPAPKIQVPEFGTRPGYTLPHEGGHHVFETIYELTGEMPQNFSPKFRAMVNEAVSVDIPRRVDFHKHYDRLLEKALKAKNQGWVTNAQVNDLAVRFLEGYKRAIPHEMFANIYQRALKEGLKGEEAVRVSLKGMINNRERMRKLAASFSMYEKRLSERLDDLIRVSKEAQKLEFPKITVRPLGGK
jgi:hypothetical protein